MSNHNRLNRIYANMKSRCYNPNKDHYEYYGGKGIKVCDEWLNPEHAKGKHNCSIGFIAFQKWAMKNGYADNLSLDRIDSNKNYEPSNCRWVTQKVQCNNQSKNIVLTYKGETKTISQWCEELNLKRTRVYDRIFNLNWPVEKALEIKEKRNCRYLTYKGKTQTIKEWAEELGIQADTISARLVVLNWSVEKALSKEIKSKN